MSGENRFGWPRPNWGLVLSLILLVVVAAASFLEYREYVQVADETRRLNSFLNLVRAYVGECLEAQANERSFLLIRSERYREAYERAVSRLKVLEGSPEISVQDAQYSELFGQLRREVDTQIEDMNAELRNCPANDKTVSCGSVLSVRAAVLAGDRVYAFRDAVLHRGAADLALSRDQTRMHAQLCAIIATTGCSGIFILVFLSATKIKKLLEEQSDLNRRLSSYADELQNIADSVPEVLWRMRENGTVEYANHRWTDVIGQPANEYGATWMSLVHPDDQLGIQSLFSSAPKDRTFLTAECRLRSPHKQTYCWFLVRALAVRDGSASGCRWYGTFTDINDQKEAQAALKRMNEELRQFAHIAAHDLQEPLRNIANLSGLVLKNHQDNLAPEATLWLEESSKNSRRMMTMVKDLLVFSTAVEDANVIGRRADGNVCLTAALAHLQAAIDETKAQIVSDLLPVVRIGESQLIRVFQNLIGNALKYRRPEIAPIIRVGARKEDSDYVFSVADNGVGFDPMYSQRIFRIFKRLHSQSEYPGNGIGLAVCARIMGHFGGRIWAEGQPGAGATFVFTLPVAEEQAAEPRTAATTM